MGLHCSIMLFTPFIVGFLLVGTGQAKSLTQKEGERLEFVINGENLELRKVADGAEERMGGLVGSIALTLLTNMIKDIVTETVLGMLGITTTPAPRPIIDAIGDLLGITEGPTTTAAPSPPGPLAGLIDLLLPDGPTTTTPTAAPTTTTTTAAAPCGGLLGLGLLDEPCTDAPTTTTAAPTTTTTPAPTTTTTTPAPTTTTQETTSKCGGLFGGGLLGC